MVLVYLGYNDSIEGNIHHAVNMGIAGYVGQKTFENVATKRVLSKLLNLCFSEAYYTISGALLSFFHNTFKYQNLLKVNL